LLGGELRRPDGLGKLGLREDVGLRGRTVLVEAVAMPAGAPSTAATFGPAILRGSIVVLQRIALAETRSNAD
jgi:hypothetical protein